MAYVAIMAGRRRAVLLQHDEVYDEDGWRMVIKIWKVPTSRNSPDGIDYSLSLISVEEAGHWLRQSLAERTPSPRVGGRGSVRLFGD
jgi:hypothetical protein